MPNRSNFSSNSEYNAWMRDYRERNREKMRAYNAEYNRLWRKKYGYYNEEKWKKSHPIEVKAEQFLQRAVSRGEIKKSPCAICGSKKSVAHHPNYKDVLKVIFLCHIHHRKYHYKKRVALPKELAKNK